MGGYLNKESLSQLLTEYGNILQIQTVINDFSAKKYGAFSWRNSPETSNSTIKDNLEAIFRHFSAHTMGEVIDVDGYPHLFNMVCRANMMVSVAIRSMNNPDGSTARLNYTDEDVTDIDKLYTEINTSSNFQYQHVTVETILALFKMDREVYKNHPQLAKATANQLRPLIVKGILRLLSVPQDTEDFQHDKFTHICAIERLYHMIILFVRKELSGINWKAYLKNSATE